MSINMRTHGLMLASFLEVSGVTTKNNTFSDHLCVKIRLLYKLLLCGTPKTIG